MFALAIHGGAGTLPRAEMSGDMERLYRAGLDRALGAGFAVLESGGTALDAVTRAVVLLEDDPLFNAGHGAVFTLDGQIELDASIMDGATLKAGAVCGVTHIKNPVELARAVMEHSDYVLLSGGGAEEFALTRGFQFVPRSYFYTAARWRQLERIRGGDVALVAADHIARGHRRRGRIGPPRPARGRHVDGRHDRQALSAHRRFADHRRGNLRR